MAKLYITEYCAAQIGPVGRVGQVPLEPPIAEQTVTISGTHNESAAFNSQTRLIRLHTDAICSVVIGTNPTATTANGRMPANMTEFRGLDTTAAAMKLSVISNV